MTDDSAAVARTITLLERGVVPPPSDSTEAIEDLLVPYCLGDVSTEERRRVVRAVAADPHVYDELVATRRALRAAGVLPPSNDASADQDGADIGDAALTQPADVATPSPPRAPLVVIRGEPTPDTRARGSMRGPARRPPRLRWFGAAGVLAAAAAAFVVLQPPVVRDASPPQRVDSARGASAPVASNPQSPRVDSGRVRASPPTVAQQGPPAPTLRPAPPRDVASPGTPPGTPGAPPLPPPDVPRASTAFAVADLGGRDSVEVRLGAADADADAVTRLVVAALPPALAADTSLRVAIVSEAPAATRGSADRLGLPAKLPSTATRRVRIVIRSTTGPCVGPEAAAVGPRADLRPLLKRATAEYRRCAGQPE